MGTDDRDLRADVDRAAFKPSTGFETPRDDVLLTEDGLLLLIDLVVRVAGKTGRPGWPGGPLTVLGVPAVGRTGLVFKDIMLDENATCRVALGNAYPFTVPDLSDDPVERANRGFNVSEIHQDIMIRGPQVDVDGIDSAGNPTPILRDDRWVIEPAGR